MFEFCTVRVTHTGLVNTGKTTVIGPNGSVKKGPTKKPLAQILTELGSQGWVVVPVNLNGTVLMEREK